MNTLHHRSTSNPFRRTHVHDSSRIITEPPLPSISIPQRLPPHMGYVTTRVVSRYHEQQRCILFPLQTQKKEYCLVPDQDTHSGQESSGQVTSLIKDDSFARPRSPSPSSCQNIEDEHSQPQADTHSTSICKKRPRYLRDIDRRMIIQRIENGEKQATLAREFGVTRAAICHINKNREEILTRYDMLLQSARHINEKEGAKHQKALIIREVCNHDALRPLLTRLRFTDTEPTAFRCAVQRVFTILLEEAFVTGGTTTIQSNTTKTISGANYLRQPCGIGVGQQGPFLLDIFARLEPDAPSGHIPNVTVDSNGRLIGLCLPPTVLTSDIFLLIATNTVHTWLRSIEILIAAGIPQKQIVLVVLICAAENALQVSRHFSEVRLVTAALEDESSATYPLLGRFWSRVENLSD